MKYRNLGLTLGALALALTALPAAAQQDRFATAPAPVIQSTLAGLDMDSVPQSRLSGLLRKIARSIGECHSVRREIERALSVARTAYDVHEDWIHLHEQCLIQGEDDLSEIAQAADNLRQGGGDSRWFEKLRAEVEALNGVVQDAYAAHEDLIASYDRTQEFDDE